MKIQRNKSTELLAPAGSFQSVMAAVNAGADAVYMGGQRFGARAYADSAQAGQEDMVMEAIRYCHLFSVKLYMTVNILFKESELSELTEYIRPYYEAGVDGLIMQDLGAVRRIRSAFPDLEVHASTQQTITSVWGARMAQELGMTRTVLARELSLQEIQKIHDESGMELEVFCHGAMCYSYSGACFMSSLLGGRSGNRGRCAGTCRLCYETAGQKGYYLSMKDMQTVELLPELIRAGAYSFKIEGRMKSPLYTAGVVSVYRKYLDRAYAYVTGELPEYTVSPEDLRILREMYDRGGTASYLKKHNGADMIARSEKSFRAADDALVQRIRGDFIDRNRILSVDAALELKVGFPASLTLWDDEGHTVTATAGENVQEARSRRMEEEELEARIRKTGGTAFHIAKVTVTLQGDAFCPVGQLNALRRKALMMYEEEILRGSYRTYRP